MHAYYFLKIVQSTKYEVPCIKKRVRYPPSVGLQQACFLFNRSLGRKVKKPLRHIVLNYVPKWLKKASSTINADREGCAEFKSNANSYLVLGT